MGETERRSAQEVRGLLEELRRPLFARVEHGAPADLGRSLGRSYADALDALLERLVGAALPAVASPSAGGTALAAVGGYGRRALALGGDLDLRLLTDDPEGAVTVAEKLLYPLWDAGLAVGHQVVTAADLLCAADDDLPSATSLLDWRLIAGEPEPSRALVAAAREGVFSISRLPAFLGRLEQDVAARHRRYGGSVYLLEPDVKNGAGGLRDLDVARWAAQARWNVAELRDLVRLGVLVGRQLDAVRQARDMLWRVRNVLHHRAGRRHDRLGFDDQQAIARRLGYVGPLPEAVEKLMSDYYRAARTCSRFRELMLTSAMPPPTRRPPPATDLGDGVQLFGGEATLASPAELERDPALALRLVHKAVERGVAIRRSARGAVVHVCGDTAFCAALRAAEEANRLFVKLVTYCGPTRLKAGSVLRELHELGLLLAMVPEFAPVVGRVHHDTYHVYTVDVHSVAAVDRLGEIVRGDIVLDEENTGQWLGSLACQVASEIARPQVLFFATLLHDVGKAIGRRDHSQRGAEMAQQVLARLGFEGQDIWDACRLIANHLEMYLMATRRDTDDPATASEMADLVGGREGLRNLYLLTVADLSTTSPTSMTSWKARMLDELYLATDAHFRSGGAATGSLIQRRRVDAANLADPRSRPFVEEFVQVMSERYLMATPAEAMTSHAELVRRHLEARREVTVALLPSRLAEVSEVCVVTDDRPRLLAAITACIAAASLQVHAAQIHCCALSGRRALAVDVFWVHHAARGGRSVAAALDRVERELQRWLVGEVSTAELAGAQRSARRRSSGEPAIASKVLVDNRASPDHTVVEVITRDRPGLLHQLAEAFAELGLGIHLAKISTEGTRVVDVFYVTDGEGRKLAERPRLDHVERVLLDLLQKIDE